jgi:hypothetical protein
MVVSYINGMADLDTGRAVLSAPGVTIFGRAAF